LPSARTSLSETPLQTAGLPGQGRYICSLALLACFYYTIPVLTTPLGYTTFLRLDDFASLLFVLVSFTSILSRPGFPETKFLLLMLVVAALAPLSAVWGFIVSGQIRSLEYGLWQSLHYVKIFLVFTSAMLMPISWHRLRRILLIAWLGSVAVGIYGTLQYLGVVSVREMVESLGYATAWGFSERVVEGRALGALSHNPACIGGYMVIAVLVAILLARTAPSISAGHTLVDVPLSFLQRRRRPVHLYAGFQSPTRGRRRPGCLRCVRDGGAV